MEKYITTLKIDRHSNRKDPVCVTFENGYAVYIFRLCIFICIICIVPYEYMLVFSWHSVIIEEIFLHCCVSSIDQ